MYIELKLKFEDFKLSSKALLTPSRLKSLKTS